jgi:hypothetical protein
MLPPARRPRSRLRFTPYYGATTLRLPLPSLAVALSLLLPACHAQTPVAQSGPAASSAAATVTALPACVATGEAGDPFVIDWPSDTRGDLEIALKRKVAVLKITCSSVRVLPDCSAEGADGFWRHRPRPAGAGVDRRSLARAGARRPLRTVRASR